MKTFSLTGQMFHPLVAKAYISSIACFEGVSPGLFQSILYLAKEWQESAGIPAMDLLYNTSYVDYLYIASLQHVYLDLRNSDKTLRLHMRIIGNLFARGVPLISLHKYPYKPLTQLIGTAVFDKIIALYSMVFQSDEYSLQSRLRSSTIYRLYILFNIYSECLRPLGLDLSIDESDNSLRISIKLCPFCLNQITTCRVLEGIVEGLLDFSQYGNTSNLTPYKKRMNWESSVGGHLVTVNIEE